MSAEMTEQQTIIRKPRINFTQVPNEILASYMISWKAKGVYAYLLSKPDGWVFHPKAIQKEGVGGKRLLNSAIKELIEKGCLERHIIRGEKGKITGIEYRFSLRCGFATEAKCNRSKKAPYNNTNSITKTNQRDILITPIPPREVGVLKECVCLLSKIAEYHTGRLNHNTSRWGASMWRWLNKNNIPSSRLLDVLQVYYNRLGDDEYMPRVRDLRELFIKFNRLEDLFTD